MRSAASMTVCFVLAIAAARSRGEEVLIYHPITVDHAGIVPWFSPDPAVAYDQCLRRVWAFWVRMRTDSNGVPYYLVHQVWKEHEDDSRGLGGDQISMALSSWNLLYGYLGDSSVKANMVEIASYWLAHGMSEPTAAWPNLPFPYNTDLHSGVYDGDMMAGKGFLQPDKAANFGAELVRLYKLTENADYLKAAVRIADTLAAKIVPGDASHSPWPFRVNAGTGSVYQVDKDGAHFEAAYTTDWAGALRLFEELVELKEPGAKAYAAAHDTVAAWMKAQPLKTNRWGPFFEDIATSRDTNTETNADTFAAYILERRQDWSPLWKEQAKGIIDWSLETFHNDEYRKYGVTVINEQTAYLVPGNSHTSRHASVELLYCEATGDCSTKAAAVRRLNWATYMVDSDGKNDYPRDDIWLTDGYGDYVRHYLRAMAAQPELAPNDQNHLLRTTSTIQSITYGDDSIVYTKFDPKSHERFKLGAWEPAGVEPAGTNAKLRWDARSKVLEVYSEGRTVTIQRRRP